MDRANIDRRFPMEDEEFTGPESSSVRSGRPSAASQRSSRTPRPLPDLDDVRAGPSTPRPATGKPDRPKTAVGSRPGSRTQSSTPSENPLTRPTTSGRSHRPVSDMDRPQTGAGRAAGGSRSLGGSRPMTAASRPVTSYHQQLSHSAGAARPLTGTVGDAAGRPFSDEIVHWDSRPDVATSMEARSGFQASGTPLPGSRASTSRLGTARPVTGAMERVHVLSRPITQQGLSGQKSVGSGRNRMVQDKSYFLGLLRTKMAELRSETGKLRRQAEALSQQQATYSTYDIRVKEVAGELLERQADLADYNVLIELMNMDSDRVAIDQEYEERKMNNSRDALLVEKLFLNRREKEEQISAIEVQLEQERRLADTLAETMSPEMREQYGQLRERYVQLQAVIERLQHQLESETTRKAQLDAEVGMSTLKQDAVELYNTLGEHEARLTELVAERNSRESPEQERERLLQQVKEDNHEIATIERRMGELNKEVQKGSEELELLETDIEESSSERNVKYRELKKREEVMEEFLESYEETRRKEEETINETEGKIVKKLENTSRNLAHIDKLPTLTAKDLNDIKESLETKEVETSKSKNTVTDLTYKHEQLTANLEKIEALDEKVQGEMSMLREKMKNMQEEMVVFSDLPALKSQHQHKSQQLSEEKLESMARREATRIQLQEAEVEHAALKKELESMDTYVQLGILERRLASIEQTNFTMTEFVASKKAEADVSAIRDHVLTAVRAENKRLQEEATAGRMKLSASSV